MTARLVVVVAAVVLVTPAARAGQAPRGVSAYFTARSYRPGEIARLAIKGSRAQGVRGAVFHAGPEARATWASGTMNGVRVPDARLRSGPYGATLRIGYWESGLYFVRLSGPGGRVGFAPFIVRARPLGTSRVAVVLPTNTWQAYNFHDDDGDGVGDSWYATPSVHTIELGRPFLDRGVPPHFANYDQGFLRWLAHTGKSADFLADDDLQRMSGDRLAALYDLVVFPGHEEYVTPHAYDAVERYRNRGGNLMFLSANNFFYRVIRRGTRIERRGRWRDLGRPEARLVGIQYLDWNQRRFRNAPYVVSSIRTAPWAFTGTGLHQGSRFGTYGIEIDARTSASPPGIRVLARVPDIFGRGRSAEMTYYETRAGARVFAAGTINFGGTAEWPPVPALLENLWSRLAQP
jgi:hypothetical protein